MKTTVSAIALIVAMTGGASAACNVSGNIIAFTINGNSLAESDCASAATVAAQGVSIASLQSSDTTQNGQIGALQTTVGGHAATLTNHGGRIGALEASDGIQNGKLAALQNQNNLQDAAIILNYAWDGAQQSQIGALQSGHAAQQGQIDGHEDRLDANDIKNGEQDGRLDDAEDKNDEQDDRLNKQKKAIVNNYKWDAHQQKQINQQGKAIAYNYAWDYMQQKQINSHGQRIGSLEGVVADHAGRLDAHSALLSDHSARLDEHAKGLAIAMAMPDAWLSDKKRFGVFGAVGGFEGETAIGLAAIGRINETWSLNTKLGADTDFDHVGWQVGVGAQW